MIRRILVSIAVIAMPLSLIAGPAAGGAFAQGVSTAVVSPASGPPGVTVTGSGSNWTPGDHIQAYWGDDNSILGPKVIVASDGTFADAGLNVPSGATQGRHQILFSDIEGRYFEVAGFDVTPCPSNPNVTFSPSSGPLGTTFTIAGTGWVPGGTVTSSLPNGSPGWFTGYQTPTVNANGSFSYTETVGTGPSGPTPPGAYVITYVEKYGDCSLSSPQTFNVTTLATSKLPYISQYQNQPKQNCDCGPAAAAMIIVGYGKHAACVNGQCGTFLQEIRTDSGNTGACSLTTKTANLNFSQLEAALRHTPWSLAYATIGKSLSPSGALAKIKAAVDAGKPVIALLHGTDLTTNPQGTLNSGQEPGRGLNYGDHFVVVKADSGTTVTFNDPDNQPRPTAKTTAGLLKYPYWLVGKQNNTLSVAQFTKALADVAQGSQPYAISVGSGAL